MKHILIIILLFSLSTQAQKKKAISVTTLTTRQLSVVTAKLQSDFTDSIKYLKDRIDVYLWQNDRLNQRQTATEKWRDSAGIYYNPDYFDIDSNHMLTPKERIDTFIIFKKSPRVPGQTNTMGILIQDAAHTELNPLAMPYIFNTGTPKEQQDIADLKWQIGYFEKLLDDDKKVMDRQLKIIKEQQAQIEKLKRKN